MARRKAAGGRCRAQPLDHGPLASDRIGDGQKRGDFEKEHGAQRDRISPMPSDGEHADKKHGHEDDPETVGQLRPEQ